MNVEINGVTPDNESVPGEIVHRPHDDLREATALTRRGPGDYRVQVYDYSGNVNHTSDFTDYADAMAWFVTHADDVDRALPA
jgi:hypothetical protein